MSLGDRPALAGGWVVDEVSYVDPVRAFCDLCGRPLTRRYWRVERDGQVLRYCEPSHADMDMDRERDGVPTPSGRSPDRD